MIFYYAEKFLYAYNPIQNKTTGLRLKKRKTFKNVTVPAAARAEKQEVTSDVRPLLE